MKIRLYHQKDRKAALYLIDLNIPEYFARSEMQDFEEYLDQHAAVIMCLI